MKDFTIDDFAKDCKEAMAATNGQPNERQQAARDFLAQTLENNELKDIIDTLEEAIPEGADIGEMIVHASPELTMLYARVPGRFQSGIHNHTVFACIGQLSGSESSTVYNKTDDGEGLLKTQELTSHVGEITSLPADAIHHIENPHDSVSSSLHIYGGDFHAIMDERSLWSFDSFEEMSFSFQGLIKESIKGMKLNDNQTGLTEIAKAIPSVKPLIDA